MDEASAPAVVFDVAELVWASVGVANIAVVSASDTIKCFMAFLPLMNCLSSSETINYYGTERFQKNDDLPQMCAVGVATNVETDRDTSRIIHANRAARASRNETRRLARSSHRTSFTQPRL